MPMPSAPRLNVLHVRHPYAYTRFCHSVSLMSTDRHPSVRAADRNLVLEVSRWLKFRRLLSGIGSSYA